MFLMTISPRQKRSWGVVALLFLVIFCLAVAAGFAMGTVVIGRQGNLFALLAAGGTLGFAFFGIELGKNAFNALFSTTQVEFDGVFLKVSNRPFGETFSWPVEKLRGVEMTEPGSPPLYRVIMVTEGNDRFRQVCVFGRSGPEVEALHEKLCRLAGEKVPG